MRILDRYLLGLFMKIFVVCVFGVPLVFIVIDLTDNLDDYLRDGTAKIDVLRYYFYQFPYQSLLAFPIAALLAAVFSVATLARHFEITAAKASGISFYRLSAPMLVAAFLISLAALGLSEVIPVTNRKARDALGDDARRGAMRSSFVYRGVEGRVYKIDRLDTELGVITDMAVERRGTGYEYPTYLAAAATARWDDVASRWVLEDGRLVYLPESDRNFTFRFAELWQREFTEKPRELLARPKDQEEMRYGELGKFIEAIQRSGGKARKLEVQQALRLAFPFACFIIVLFGVPLANSTRRGGTPASIGIALLTTILLLLLARISEALGVGGVIPPVAAAWLPNFVFLGVGLWLMATTRT